MHSILSHSGAVRRAWPLVLLFACCLSVLVNGIEIKGKVGTSVDGISTVPLRPGTVTELLLTGAAGEVSRTFADRDGWFTLRGVPPGSYLLTTINPTFVYPEVLVEVSVAAGLSRAAYAFNKQPLLTSPLIIRPAGVAQYYELRKPLDVWSFVKSPYGLMIGFMLFGIFVFPMLKVDQEEYREAMASLRGEGPPVQTAAAARLRDR